MKKLVFVLLVCLSSLFVACGSNLNKRAAGLILAEYMKGNLLLEIDLWSDLGESVGDFIICNPDGKVVYIRANFTNEGQVKRVLATQIAKDTLCTIPKKQN